MPLQAVVDAAVSGRRGLYVAGEPGRRRTEFIQQLMESLPLEGFVVAWLEAGAGPDGVADLLATAAAERARRDGGGQILLVVDQAELLPDRTLELLNRAVALLEGEAAPRFVVAGSAPFEARLASMAPALNEYLAARVDVPRPVREAAAASDRQLPRSGRLSAGTGVKPAQPMRRAAALLDRSMMAAAVVGACLMAGAIVMVYQSARHGAPLEAGLPARPGPAVSEALASPAPAPDTPANAGEQSVASLPEPPVQAPEPLAEPEPPVAAGPPASDPVPAAGRSNAAATPANDLPLWLRGGGPGLVLVARRHDTLQGLYHSIYTGVKPPPFSVVQDANPNPIRPGTVLVFPTPPGGWNKPPG